MATLDEISIKYGTDKSSLLHGYTEKYQIYFEPLRFENLKILEIGIQNGYSLKTWKEYFPNSTIFGIDVNDCTYLKEDRINPIVCNQTDNLLLQEINSSHGPFDIIIDDGSHVSDHMKDTFNFLFPLLKEGGIYVVEDLHCCYWDNFTFNTSFMDRIKELMDLTNSSGKCGLANIKKIEEDGFYQARTKGEMNWWESNIEFIHLYRSIVFIKKYL